MKVLVLVKNFNKNTGGIGNYYRSLQNKYSIDVEFFFHNYNFSNTFRLLKPFILLLNIVRFPFIAYRKDIIHLNPSLDNNGILRDSVYLILSKIFVKKVVVFFRGWHSHTESKITYNNLLRFFFQLIFNKADAIIVLSQNFVSRLKVWGIKKPLYIETTTIDDDLLFNYAGKGLFNKIDSIKILFLARVEKSKGIFELLNAVKILQDVEIDIHLVIGGEGKALDEARYFCKENGIKNVDFLGYVKDYAKSEAFLNADLYVFPTYTEGMPNSVLEAMAFGLPVITRPVGGIPDFFEDGKMGFLTESKDPKVFAEMIEKLINNPELHQQISEYNYNYAKEHFYASKVAKRIEKIYEEVMNNEK